MSGPKISRYELREAEKRRVRMRAIKEDRLIGIQECIAEIREFCKNDGVSQELKDRVKVMIDRRVDMSDSIDEVQAFSTALRDCKNEIAGQIRKAAAAERGEQRSMNLDITFDFGEDISDDLLSPVGNNGSEERSDDTIEYKKLEIKTEFEIMRENTVLSDELRRQISDAIVSVGNITDGEYLKNFEAVTAQKIRKNYREFIEAFEAKRLEQLVAEKEQEYIASVIDEVMVEMGYELLGSRQARKKSGETVKNGLYAFDGDTSLLVTYSDDGKIAMEVGATDNTDREPTEQEKARLVYDMERFCGGFAEIEQRLSERGVVLKERMAMLPPTYEYAQIINTEGFDMIETQDRTRKKPALKTRYLGNR